MKIARILISGMLVLGFFKMIEDTKDLGGKKETKQEETNKKGGNDEKTVGTVDGKL